MNITGWLSSYLSLIIVFDAFIGQAYTTNRCSS